MARILPLTLLAMASAFSAQQAHIAREVMRTMGPPDWAVLIDGVQVSTYAYAIQSEHRIFIDARRFDGAPRAFANTCIHEVGHLMGGQHGDGSLPMSYALTTWPNGTIHEDERLLLPIPSLHL